MFLLGLIDLLLKLRLTLAHVHVVDELVFSLNSNCHELGLSAMALALDMLHNLVIGGELLFVLGQAAIHTINGGISDEFLELWHVDEVGHITVEHHIVSHAKAALIIFIVLALAHTVGQAPASAALTIWLSHFLLLGFVNQLMPTHIDKGLLVKERLLLIADHLLASRLDAEA